MGEPLVEKGFINIDDNQNYKGTLYQDNGRQVDFVMMFTIYGKMNLALDYREFEGQEDKQVVLYDQGWYKDNRYVGLSVDGKRYYFLILMRFSLLMLKKMLFQVLQSNLAHCLSFKNYGRM